jgi:glycosyltransferase involved in cell wall biosynthesis
MLHELSSPPPAVHVEQPQLRPRVTIVVSHPIQHFSPWFREIAVLGRVDLRVLFCCDWGTSTYMDPDFRTAFKWDIDLLGGYAHDFLPIRKRPHTMGFFQIDNPRVADALDAFDPDVIVLFGYAYLTNWRVRSWARKNRKMVMLYSDSNVKVADTTSRVKAIVKKLMVGHFYDGVDAALYVGNNNVAYHESFKLPRGRLFRCALPVDCSRLLANVPDPSASRSAIRKRFDIPEEAFVMIWSGKYIARKRPLDLISAVALMAEAGRPVYALMVGEGPERAAMEEAAAKLPRGNIVLTGFINQSEIPGFYAASDCLVVTSDYDPHPLVITEAATFGLPVVGSDALGCIGEDDTLQAGVNGLTYRCGDVAALTQALVRLEQDRPLHERMGTAGRAIAKTQDVKVAAGLFCDAVDQLQSLGPRAP